jgi:hypothetical protein
MNEERPMSNRIALAATALLSIVPLASSADAEADRARAEAAVADLGQSLRGALVAAMERSGPVGAVGFCHDEAPRITAAVGDRHGVRIGRTGVRLRNPGNRPEPWLAEVVAGFEREAAAGAPPPSLVAVSAEGLPPGIVLRYARGIGTEAACLVCHGQSVAEPVRAAIRERYPDDAATGFGPGDLRGAFWVEVPSGEIQPASGGSAHAAGAASARRDIAAHLGR